VTALHSFVLVPGNRLRSCRDCSIVFAFVQVVMSDERQLLPFCWISGPIKPTFQADHLSERVQLLLGVGR
jgi:hypothetical protein